MVPTNAAKIITIAAQQSFFVVLCLFVAHAFCAFRSMLHEHEPHHVFADALKGDEE